MSATNYSHADILTFILKITVLSIFTVDLQSRLTGKAPPTSGSWQIPQNVRVNLSCNTVPNPIVARSAIFTKKALSDTTLGLHRVPPINSSYKLLFVIKKMPIPTQNRRNSFLSVHLTIV